RAKQASRPGVNIMVRRGCVALVFFFAAGVSSGGNLRAQGIYLGPGGISFGAGSSSYYIPFNDGRNYYGYDRGYYGNYYGPRDYFYRGSGSYYWQPGMTWRAGDYWYGDQHWPRYSSPIRIDLGGGLLRGELGIQ